MHYLPVLGPVVTHVSVFPLTDLMNLLTVYLKTDNML